MDPVWLLLLLPVAATSGWIAAKGIRLSWHNYRGSKPTSDYYRGLNYLLNEQPDKAIEAFMRVLEVDTDTVEMHMALGNLYRRRGELERATRIHQNLVARKDLDNQLRFQALDELAQDYLKAGLFDRAESLLLELAEVDDHQIAALENLRHIYEQEKEWRSAISVVSKLSSFSGESNSDVIAQYWCEMAESALTQGQYWDAGHFAEEALKEDSRLVRATLQLGRIQAMAGRHEKAITIWQSIHQQNPEMLGEAIELIVSSFKFLDDGDGLKEYLVGMAGESSDVRLPLALADLNACEQGGDPEQALLDWIREHPSIRCLQRVIQLRLERADDKDVRDLNLLDRMIGEVVDRESSYECEECGFTGKNLHWQCPGCQRWNSVRLKRPRSRAQNTFLGNENSQLPGTSASS